MTFAEQWSCLTTARRRWKLLLVGTINHSINQSSMYPRTLCCTGGTRSHFCLVCLRYLSAETPILNKSEFMHRPDFKSACKHSPFRIIQAAKPAYKHSWHHSWADRPARSLRTQGQPVTIRQSDTLYKYIFIEAGQEESLSIMHI